MITLRLCIVVATDCSEKPVCQLVSELLMQFVQGWVHKMVVVLFDCGL